MSSLTLIREYVRFSSEPGPKHNLQVAHGAKLRKDQLYLKFWNLLSSTETCKISSIEKDAKIGSELNWLQI